MITMMKLTIVGCSGSLSGPDSPASSYLIQAPYQDRIFSLLIDCGPGAMGALYRYCLDLCGYYVAARYSPSAPWPRRPVYAPANAASRITRAYDVPHSTGEAGPTIAEHFEWRTWQSDQRIGPFTVRAVRVEPGSPGKSGSSGRGSARRNPHQGWRFAARLS